jgi:Fe-S-cluster containining protein
MQDYDERFKNMGQDSPFNNSPVMPTMLDGSTQLKFRCHRGVKCWNACCSNIDITLTPYDILRLKNRFGISSGEFLQKYTVPYEMDKDGTPGVKLRCVDGGTACQFMVEEGCSVYEDRPTACRYYPVALLSVRNSDEYVDRLTFALVKEDTCFGHQEPDTQTIDEYRAAQGAVEYDEKGRGWRQLILKKKSAGPAIGKPPTASARSSSAIRSTRPTTSRSTKWQNWSPTTRNCSPSATVSCARSCSTSAASRKRTAPTRPARNG